MRRKRAVDSQEVLGANLVVNERLRVLNDCLDGVLGVARRIGFATDESVRAEDSSMGSRQALLGREKLAALLNFVDEGVLDESLVEEEGVVVDDVDEVGTGGSARSTSELLGLGGVLAEGVSEAAFPDAGRAEQGEMIYPEGDRIDTDALRDHALGERALSLLYLDRANVAEDWARFVRSGSKQS